MAEVHFVDIDQRRVYFEDKVGLIELLVPFDTHKTN
jgi:hypothetical protein